MLIENSCPQEPGRLTFRPEDERNRIEIVEAQRGLGGRGGILVARRIDQPDRHPVFAGRRNFETGQAFVTGGAFFAGGGNGHRP